MGTEERLEFFIRHPSGICYFFTAIYLNHTGILVSEGNDRAPDKISPGIVKHSCINTGHRCILAKTQIQKTMDKRSFFSYFPWWTGNSLNEPGFALGQLTKRYGIHRCFPPDNRVLYPILCSRI